MIPTHAFSIWVGERLPPADVLTYTRQMKEMNSRDGWSYHFWGNEIYDLYGSDPYVKRLLAEKASLAFVVDRLRALMLRDRGGVWVDSDCKPVRPLSALNRILQREDADFVTGIRNPWRPNVALHRGVALVDNTVMASAKGGKMIQRLCALYTPEAPKQTGHSMGVEVMRTMDETTTLLNYRYFYADEPFPETILLHDALNLGSWSHQPQPVLAHGALS